MTSRRANGGIRNNIVSLVGADPILVEAAPLMRELRRHPDITPVLVPSDPKPEN